MDSRLKQFWNKANGIAPSRQLQEEIPSVSANLLLTFIQQWYQHNKEPLSVPGIDLCELLCMNENQLRHAKKFLLKNGYIKTKFINNSPINSYLLVGQSNDIQGKNLTDNRTTDKDLEEQGKSDSAISVTSQEKGPNLAKNQLYLSPQSSDNILTTILKQNNVLSELSKIQKYSELYAKFGTKVELDLSCLLYEEIMKNRPGYFAWKLKKDKCAIAKIILKWCKDMDKLIRIDGRDPELVLDVILWCQQDSFWNQNIKSVEKLRIQFPKLYEQMDNNKNTGVCRTRDMHPEITKELMKRYTRDFLAGKKVQWEAKDKEKFIKAARLLVKFADEGKLIQTNVPGYLMRCLYVNYTEEEKAVVPGHLCSSRTWDVLMPQYLTELGVIYSI